MAWYLIPVYSGNFEASSKEKIFAKSKYLVKIEMRVSFATNAAIWALQERWTSLFWLLLGLSREVIYITKVLYSGSRAIATNFFFPSSSTYLVVRRASSMV